eukprot:scaffold316991_cov25-Prasinocladus_malaysianus.AAC.1
MAGTSVDSKEFEENVRGVARLQLWLLLLPRITFNTHTDNSETRVGKMKQFSPNNVNQHTENQ